MSKASDFANHQSQFSRHRDRLRRTGRRFAERRALPRLLLDGKWQLQCRRLVRPQIVKLVIHKVIARRGVVKVQSQMDHKLTVSMPALHGHFSEIVLPSNRLSSCGLDGQIHVEAKLELIILDAIPSKANRLGVNDNTLSRLKSRGRARGIDAEGLRFLRYKKSTLRGQRSLFPSLKDSLLAFVNFIERLRVRKLAASN